MSHQSYSQHMTLWHHTYS